MLNILQLDGATPTDIRHEDGSIIISIEPSDDAVVKHCHANGVLVLNAGTYANVIRFLPPLVITDDLLRDAVNVIEQALQKL